MILISVLISMVAHYVDFFNPMEKAFKDFTLTDIIYTPFEDEHGNKTNFSKGSICTDIVLVNIGGPSVGRDGLAAELDRINQFSPAVVGIDAFFKRPGDPYADSLLAESFRRTKHLVLGSKLDNLDTVNNHFRSLTTSMPQLNQHAETGFVNFITGGDEGYLTTRRFSAKEEYADTSELGFTAKILSIYNPKKYRKLAERDRGDEVINYSGNIDHFFRLDYWEVMDTSRDLSFLKGKVVLMGYLGEPLGRPSLDDVFFTPLNAEMAGRSVPDMYGITVHANILAMMLNESYITKAPWWFDRALAVVICMLNVSIFLFIGEKYRRSSQLLMRIVQIIQGTILTGLIIYLLAEKDIYVEFTLSLTLLFLCADLTEIYDGSLHSIVELYRKRIGRPVNARSKYYKKRRLFSK